MRYHYFHIKLGLRWLWRSREITNFTYNSPRYAQWAQAAHVCAVTGISLEQARAYAEELLHDKDLAGYIAARHPVSERHAITNATLSPGHRLLNYILVRALKPNLVVEAGVESGLGAIIICAALARNEQENAAGNFIGIEGNPGQNCSLYLNYPGRRGEILRGDAADMLQGLSDRIDLYFHETGPSLSDITRQLAALESRLAERGVIQTISPQMAFIDFAQRRRMRLLMCQDLAQDLFRPNGAYVTTLFPAPPSLPAA